MNHIQEDIHIIYYYSYHFVLFLFSRHLLFSIAITFFIFSNVKYLPKPKRTLLGLKLYNSLKILKIFKNLKLKKNQKIIKISIF